MLYQRVKECFTHYNVIQSIEPLETLYATCTYGCTLSDQSQVLLKSLILDFLFAAFLLTLMDVTLLRHECTAASFGSLGFLVMCVAYQASAH